MLFNSIEFLVFFPTVIAVYFAMPQRFRWILLLIASYFFYMSWNPSYIVLIMVSTVVDYSCAIGIENQKNKKVKLALLYLSLFVNLGFLVFFKYFNFLGDAFNSLFEPLGIFPQIPGHNILLPVGISFYTFQTLSYTIDVYKGKLKAERHLGYFALYVSFFPQLVAGPIERASRLLPQFYEKFEIEYERIKKGLLMVLWGFLLKLTIADRLSEYVDSVFNEPNIHNGLQKLTAAYFFIFQVYGDFAGYSYIAIGIALIMGYELMDNFKRPYLSVSFQEFWNRWHISLSTWILDYVYTPIVLSKRHWGIYGIAFALLVTFVLNGLWHGANWNFIVFGFILGIYIGAEFLLKKQRKKLKKKIGKGKFRFFGWIATMCLWIFACIFFRINSLGEVWSFLGGILDFSSYSTTNLNLFKFPIDFVISLILIHLIWGLEFFQEKNNLLGKFKKQPSIIKWTLVIFLLLFVIFIGKYNSSAFIYFQF